MKLLIKVIILLSANLFVSGLDGQNIMRTFHYATDNIMEIKTDLPIGSIVLRGKEEFPASAEVIANGYSTKLSRDEHITDSDTIWTSNLIVFEPTIYTFAIKGLSEGISYEVITIRLPEAEKQYSHKIPASDCSEPDMILQSEWRAGLPPPDYERIFNTVQNLIIHHSATSNSLTDYTALVRSIYTYHTGVNGWSDIGYNYLIAPDGTIFAGRDPGNDMETHQVLGAHFCASNTGTMGICLLGTYMDTAPSADMTASLVRLISWKAALDSLPPLSTHHHPLHPEMPVIAGHRDGCSTLCPGDVVYNQLDAYRNQTQDFLVSCGIFLGFGSELHASKNITLAPNPVTGNEITIRTQSLPVLVAVYDFNGRLCNTSYHLKSNVLQLPPSLPKGIYFLKLAFAMETQWIKFVRL